MKFELVGGEIKDVEVMPSNASFYEHAKKVGPSKYIPVDYIKIKTVGQRDFMSRPATDEDKAAYPQEWAAYQSGLSVENEGTTPLNSLANHRQAFALDLANMGIHTIEELAIKQEVPDYLIPMWKEAKARILALEIMESEDAEGCTESKAG